VELLESRLAQLEARLNPGAPNLTQLPSLPEVGDETVNNIRAKPARYCFRQVENATKIRNGITSELEIRDKSLIQLLKDELGKYPGVHFDGDLVVVASPFPAIVSLFRASISIEIL
jgi:hypothetical protein